MATVNPFDLLDGDFGDPSEFLAAAEQKVAEKPKKIFNAGPAKLPTKPPPPSQAVKETKVDVGVRGGRGGGLRGFGRGRLNFNRESNSNENNYSASNGNGGFKPLEDGKTKISDRSVSGDRPRGGFRGGRRGGFTNGDATDGDRPRRAYERRSGTGRGNEVKREGSGRGNWGTNGDEITARNEENVAEVEKEAASDKPTTEEGATEVAKTTEDEKDPEPEDKEMTLEEYEKVREEKRKALIYSKTEERKVDVDKEFKSMHALSSKKSIGEEIFIKLGSEKDKKKDTEKEEKAKKSVSINEFLKPAEGDKYNGYGGRGRGRGRFASGGFRGNAPDVSAPKIEDIGQFPSLGAK